MTRWSLIKNHEIKDAKTTLPIMTATTHAYLQNFQFMKIPTLEIQ